MSDAVVLKPGPAAVFISEQDRPVIVMSVDVEAIEISSLGAAGGSSSFEFLQASAAATWTVNHNLGRTPAVTILSPGGVEVEAQVTHTSLNQTVIQFNAPYAGKAVMR